MIKKTTWEEMYSGKSGSGQSGSGSGWRILVHLIKRVGFGSGIVRHDATRLPDLLSIPFN